MPALEVTDLRPRARPTPRPKRHRTTAIVLHHFAVPPLTAKGMQHFFYEDPEGVATVTLPGSYASKLPTIELWRAHGVPDRRRAQAFVPYHLVVDPAGSIALCLDFDDVGAHAAGANSKSVAICMLGDFARAPPPPAQIEAVKGLLLSLVARYGNLDLWSHDDVMRRQHQDPKGCPGLAVPVRELRAWLDAQSCWSVPRSPE